jgi:hydrogenase maturation protease
MKHIRVIGVGNPYRRDEGVGPAVIEGLRHLRLSHVELVDCDGEPTRLLDLWARADLAIVVHTIQTASSAPGAVYRRSLLHPSFSRSGSAAIPAGDIHDAVTLAAGLDLLPTRMLCYSVQACDTSTGVGLTPPVAVAVADLVAEIADEVTWRAARR